VSREVWRRLETVNAVTYFADECRGALRDLGLRGFWMGYFAARAAPMGPVSAPVVQAAFYNFHPAMVRRAIPDAWAHAAPAAIVAARSHAAADAIRRLAPRTDATCAELLPLVTKAIEHGNGRHRPLFTANRTVEPAGDPLADVWQAATTLREHRGDGHVELLAESEIDGCEAHVLFAATESVAAETLRDNRGWSHADWDAAADRLQGRGLLGSTREPTDAGRTLRAHIELRTDELAAQPYETLTEQEVRRLLELAGAIAEPVASSGVIPFPNPMGLPRPR
jgi:hypothetical protein